MPKSCMSPLFFLLHDLFIALQKNLSKSCKVSNNILNFVSVNHNFTPLVAVVVMQRPRQGKMIVWGMDFMELAFI